MSPIGEKSRRGGEGVTQLINKVLGQLDRRQDVVLALIFVVAIVMMIFPLPLIMIDFMIAVNLAVAVLLLLIATYTVSAAEFSSFPTILLITTLYRLALTLSTSRMILLKREAGNIITAFGQFVVGGNIAVGIIVFVILTLIQFMVITKGAERVAEVSARFSLDAMPGKQMSIDGDMRAGTISADEAKRQRLLVQQESQLYGAMDGAMKFIKGDAIASIIVILVNVLGGMAIGVLQQGLSATEAASIYTILSIGDGLVSQIPALMISITSGIIVTRVPGGESSSLGHDLFGQLGQHAQPLFIASALLALMAWVPGFPIFAFLILSALVGALAVAAHQRPAKTSALSSPGSPASATPTSQSGGAIPLSAQFPAHWGARAIQQALESVHVSVLEHLGLALPEIVTLPHGPDDPPNLLAFYLYQDLIFHFEMAPDARLALLEGPELLPGATRALFDFSGPTAAWLAPETIFEASADRLFKNEALLVYCLNRMVAHLSREFLGIQEARYLMEAMESRYGELVKEVQRQVPLSRLTDVLQRLLEEGISIKNLRGIFEALIAWSSKEKDVVLLTEYVRIALKRQIVAQCRDVRKGVQVWNVGERLENFIRASIRQTTAGSYAALTPDQNESILRCIQKTLGELKEATLLTVVDVRRYLRKIIEHDLFDVRVVSRQELGEETAMTILGNIEWLEEEEEDGSQTFA